MSPVPRDRPDWLDTQIKISYNGEQRWRERGGDRIYTYDRLHGHVEVFTKRGRHLGVVDAHTGEWIAGLVKGRKINV